MKKDYADFKVLFASHTYMGGPYVVGSHHLAREMGKLGAQVLHLSTPVTLGHALSLKNQTSKERLRIWRNPERLEGNIVNCVPFSLLHWKVANHLYRYTGMNWFLKSTVFPTLSRIIKKYGFYEVDLLLIDQPFFAGIHQYVNAKKTIYRATDLSIEMIGDQTIAKAEEEIISRSDGLIATSEPVLRSIRRFNDDLPFLLIQNGVDYEHFIKQRDEPKELTNLPGKKAVYVGALDHRFDLEAILALAQQMPDLHIILIGPFSSHLFCRTAPYSNIHVLGPRNYNEIPAYLQYSDVGLLPLSTHKANQGRSPMKLYEYAAAGLPVVVRETEEMVRRQESFMYFYNNIEEFVASTTEAIHAKREEIGDQIKRVARMQTWECKTREILEFCMKE